MVNLSLGKVGVLPVYFKDADEMRSSKADSLETFGIRKPTWLEDLLFGKTKNKKDHALELRVCHTNELVLKLRFTCSEPAGTADDPMDISD